MPTSENNEYLKAMHAKANALGARLIRVMIGANGAASALTANPLGYLSAYLGATHIIIPYYNA